MSDLRPGWLARQFARVDRDIEQWPEAMKREAGFTVGTMSEQPVEVGQVMKTREQEIERCDREIAAIRAVEGGTHRTIDAAMGLADWKAELSLLEAKILMEYLLGLSAFIMREGGD